MRIFVTGSTGFIGREFVKQAEAAGHHLTCTGREWVIALPFWDGVDAVVHLAAAGVKRERREWAECMDVNFHGIRGLLQSIASSGFSPTVFLARSAREDALAGNPLLWGDAYYVSKFLGGQFAEAWQHHYAGRVIMPLLASCYEPGQVEAVAASILRDITA